MESFGVVARGHEKRGRSVGSDSEQGQQVGRCGDEQRLDLLFQLGDLGVEGLDPVGQ
jgi:hypothetical protein